MIARAGVAIAAAWYLVACGLVRDSDPLALDRDVFLLESVVFTGSRTVFAVSGFAHREGGPPPVVALFLEGPEGRVQFTPVEHSAECPSLPFGGSTTGVFQCLYAVVSAPIAGNTVLKLAGSGPEGPIEGSTITPDEPTVLVPERDTVVMRVGSAGNIASITIRLAAAPRGVQALILNIASIEVVLNDGEIRQDCMAITDPPSGEALDSEVDVSLRVRFVQCDGAPVSWREITMRLRILGYDDRYRAFVDAAERGIIRQPWPAFGLSGAIGVFASAAVSRTVSIRIR